VRAAAKVRAPAESKEEVAVPPNAAVLEVRRPEKRLVEVAFASVVLPVTVRVLLALSAPPTLKTLLMVEEPVTAKEEEVALSALKFWKVEEAVAKRLAAAKRPERVALPRLLTEKSVEVEKTPATLEEEATAKMVVLEEDAMLWTVRVAKGVLVPIPTEEAK
jgi:hypothetical protein